MTEKRAGHPCPSCGALMCAEHAQLGQPPRWSCACGAGGELTGSFTARAPLPPPAPPPSPTKRHWADRGPS